VLKLRALSRADVPLLDSRERPERAGEFNDFGPSSDPGGLEGVLTTGLVPGSEMGYLVVEVDGEVAGSVSWHTVSYGPNYQSRCPNIGIALLPSWRGLGYGSPAQRMLADYLFATSSAQRVEASTDVANVAEQRSLERAGFTREGVTRCAQWRAGAWHDVVTYARLRADA
jgi:RimJ/RimL family protein N-acetyltransferase